MTVSSSKALRVLEILCSDRHTRILASHFTFTQFLYSICVCVCVCVCLCLCVFVCVSVCVSQDVNWIGQDLGVLTCV